MNVVQQLVVVLLRMAYIIYEDSSAMCAAFDKLIADPPSLAGKQLRLMKYDPAVEWPAGNSLLLFLLPPGLVRIGPLHFWNSVYQLFIFYVAMCTCHILIKVYLLISMPEQPKGPQLMKSDKFLCAAGN